MSDKVRQIIKNQWPLRNSVNRDIRRQARNLIRAHIELLRLRIYSGERAA